MSLLRLLLPTLAIAASTFALPSQRESRAATTDPTVTTTSGRITGHRAPQTPDVDEYLGVPFARPPVDDLRWLAPQPLNSSAAFNASSFGTTCASNGILGGAGITDPAYPYHDTIRFGPQGVTLLNNEAQAGYASGEDCLTLNIWAPAAGVNESSTSSSDSSPNAGKAVLLWLYGGGFNFGSTQDPWYHGASLAAAQSVVVVTAAYRTGIFGFPGAPGLPRQNLGLLDQRAAVEWVRDNIGGFGGDATRITLFGQSAGASSVDYYSFAWADEASEPIVAGLIAQSGSVFREMPKSAAEAAGTWERFAGKLGCGGEAEDGDAAVLDCMRAKSTAEILSAVGGAPGLGQIASSTTFGPVVDEIVAFSDYDARAAAGRILRRPLLLGNTDYEAGIAQPVVQALTGFAIPKVVLDLVTTAVYACPMVLRAQYSLKADIPTWRYRWFGQWSNTVVAYEPDTGAYHESDIPVVFGNTEIYGGKNTAEEEAIVKDVQGGWAAFAKDPKNGLIQHGWPKFDGSNNLLQLAKDNKTGPNPAPAALYDTGCGLVNLPDNAQAFWAEITDKLEALGWQGNSTLLQSLVSAF